MVDFTFTADSATDQLTITAHGLLTGAGPAAVYNFDGALPTGTPAINSTADLWIIVVDANHVKLATSSANAFAGTAIDITANGSGTHRLYLGLPTRRNRTYAAGVQVFSTDLNAFADGFTGRKKPPFERRFFPRLAFPGTTNVWVPNTLTIGGGVASPVIQSTGGTGAVANVEIPYEPGERILGLHLNAAGDGSADIQFDVFYAASLAVAASTLSTLTDVNRAAAWGKIIMPSFVAQVLASDSVLFLRLSPTATGYQIGPCTAWFDRL